jgi:hypothetical protein
VRGGPYYWMAWNKKDAGANVKCPLKIDLDEKTWAANDLEFESFLKSGAVDNFKETDKALGISPDKSPTKGLPPSCTYHSARSGIIIVCAYDHAKSLERVEIRLENGSKGTVRITIPQGSVSLPTSHENLTRELGEPLQHRTGHDRRIM